ncbi:hypothetical protein PG991_003568 [Apiospora marii]|uniref:Uncharacterized protein n=1 Tax=Apiospora marii TaxID=335849 RepID=A0ABR1S3U5_9PEZI
MKSGHHAPPSSAQGLSYPPLPPREDLNTAFANSDMSPEDSEYFRICVDKSQSTLAQNAWQHEVRRKSSPEDSLWYNVWNEPYRHAQFFRMADFMDIDAEEDFAATARFYERLQRRYPCANFMSLPGFVHICTLLHLLLESENELPCDDATKSSTTSTRPAAPKRDRNAGAGRHEPDRSHLAVGALSSEVVAKMRHDTVEQLKANEVGAELATEEQNALLGSGDCRSTPGQKLGCARGRRDTHPLHPQPVDMVDDWESGSETEMENRKHHPIDDRWGEGRYTSHNAWGIREVTRRDMKVTKMDVASKALGIDRMAKDDEVAGTSERDSHVDPTARQLLQL